VDEGVRPEQLGQSTGLDPVDHGRLQVRLNRSRHIFVLATSDLLEVDREPLELLILVTASLDVLSRLVQAVFLRTATSVSSVFRRLELWSEALTLRICSQKA
jgi:hypothetical protein